MDFDRFLSDENVALYRLLASSTDVHQRRTILRLLADETAKLKSELQQSSSRRLLLSKRCCNWSPQIRPERAQQPDRIRDNAALITNGGQNGYTTDQLGAHQQRAPDCGNAPTQLDSHRCHSCDSSGRGRFRRPNGRARCTPSFQIAPAAAPPLLLR